MGPFTMGPLPWCLHETCASQQCRWKVSLIGAGLKHLVERKESLEDEKRKESLEGEKSENIPVHFGSYNNLRRIWFYYGTV